jgi:hypothetical protein
MTLVRITLQLMISILRLVHQRYYMIFLLMTSRAKELELVNQPHVYVYDGFAVFQLACAGQVGGT